jgi:hypothetical protein
VDAQFTLNGADPQVVTYLMRPMTPAMNLRATSIEAGGVIHAVIGLNARTAEDRTVQLETDHPEWAKVPSTVTIPQGENSTVVDIPTISDAANHTIKIREKFNTHTVESSVAVVSPIQLLTFTAPTEVVGGSTMTVTVALKDKAPNAGSEISITGDGFTLPSTTIKIRGGAKSATALIQVPDLAARVEGKIIAKHINSEISKPIVVKPNDIALALSSASVVGGSSDKVDLIITPLLRVQEYAFLTSSDPLIVPVYSQVNLGFANVTSIPLKHYRVTEQKEITITAKFRGFVHTIKLVVKP